MSDVLLLGHMKDLYVDRRRRLTPLVYLDVFFPLNIATVIAVISFFLTDKSTVAVSTFTMRNYLHQPFAVSSGVFCL